MRNLTSLISTITIEEIAEKIIDYRGKTPQKEKQGIKLITAKVIKDGYIVSGNHEYISENTYQTWMTRGIPKKGDVLITTEAPLGEVAQLRTSEKIALAQRVILIRGKPDLIDQTYLLYSLKTAFVQNQLYEKAVSTTVLGIKQSDLRKVKIPLPPLEEQKRIAKILTKADKIRRTRRYALELSDTYLQSVFLEMFGSYLHLDTKYKFQDVLEIPLNNGMFEKNHNYGAGTPVIWVDDLYHTISIDTSSLRRAKIDEQMLQKYEVIEGDLLFTRSSLVREGTGQINIVPQLKERTVFECHTIRARLKKNKVNPYYILGLYRSSYGKRLIMQRANTATMTTIGQDALNELLCPIPPLKLQEKFAKIVQKYERIRKQQQEAERQADHLFQSLLHQFFSQ